MTLQHKSSKVVESITGWMTQAILAGNPVETRQVVAWRDALLTTDANLKAREQAVAQAEANRVAMVGVDRISIGAAEFGQSSINHCVQRLCALAADAATYDELREIEQIAIVIIDTVETLTIGVARPDPTRPLPTTTTPDIGA